MEKLQHFQHIEELDEYVKIRQHFDGEIQEIAPYEVIKNDKNFKVFVETEEYIKYMFDHKENPIRFSLVSVLYSRDELSVKKMNISEEELFYMSNMLKRGR